jgi:alanyl-tRNA synthetase
LKGKIEELNGVNYLEAIIDLDASSIKDILFNLKGEVANFVGVIGGKDAGKCSLSVIAADNIVSEKEFHAGNTIREVSKLIQGGGGGQPNFATAGGKNADGLKEAMTIVKSKI